ncbi:MAG: tetratricopeptide repeat protein [Chthonomonadales bacterium]
MPIPEPTPFDDLWTYSDPAATETAFRKILPTVNGLEDRRLYLELQTQIVRTLGLQRQFDDAHSLLETIADDCQSYGKRPMIRYLLELGRTFNSSGFKDIAHPLFIQAFELGKELGDETLTIDAAHMVAIVETDEKAINWNLTAIAMAEVAEDPRARKWMGSLTNNLGWTYHDRGECDRALELFQKALDYRLTVGDAETIRIARWCVARCLRSLGCTEEALNMQLEQYSIRKAVGKVDGFNLQEIGECLLDLGRVEDSHEWFGKAYESLSKDPWVAANQPELLERLKMNAQPAAAE